MYENNVQNKGIPNIYIYPCDL